MKKMKTISGIAAAVALFAVNAYACGGLGCGGESGSSVTANASAAVVAPVLIAQTAALSFGTFSASLTQTGTIDTSGNVTGGVGKITTGTPGAFVATGLSGASYTIVGDPSVTLSDTVNSASPVMIATLAYPSSPRVLTGGTDSFNVTGVLAIPAGQPSDPYAGTYNISVHY